MSLRTTCAECGEPTKGQLVRALGTVFHLDCFICLDCGILVATKFFPIDGQDGRQHPLCERDYFRRLNLICASCDMALRGSYITACNKKYHEEHFTCSLCSTVLDPQDDWYEHEGGVYCHFDYSTQFATKCAGCNSAILKQVVEVTRNMRDESWHPECHMINEFLNVKQVVKRPTSPLCTADEESEPAYVEEERETPISPQEKQNRMERQVYKIRTVLSGFEESSVACISGTLEQVNNGQYLEAIRLAEVFILHVEVLFATIDDLEYHFARLHLKGMSHVHEARMLCSKIVDLFMLLSRNQQTGARRMGMTQELLALVTGLTYYLKILIRIALSGALRLEKEHNVGEAMTSFLDKLHSLAVHGANPSTRRMIKGQDGKIPPREVNHGTQGVTYGFQSLAPENAGDPPFREGSPNPSSSFCPSDLCVGCKASIKGGCVRLGTYQRWHWHCVRCLQCGERAAHPPPEAQYVDEGETEESGAENQPLIVSTTRRSPADVVMFMYDPVSTQEEPSFGDVPTVILCTDHAHAGCRGGFQPVERLEQYAFLLNVAVRRVYLRLKKRGVIPLSPALESIGYDSPSTESSDPHYRKAAMQLDRKLSGTARVPKRSTIVEGPPGELAHASDPTSSNRHLDPIARQDAQWVNQMSPFPQSYQGGMHPSRNKFPDPTNQASDQLTRPTIARNDTEDSVVDDSDSGSPIPEPFIPLVGPDSYGRPPTRPGTPRPVHIPPLERLEGYRDYGPGLIPVVRLNSSPEGIALADIPQLVEATQAREQQRSPAPDDKESMSLVDIPQLKESAQEKRSFVFENVNKEVANREEAASKEQDRRHRREPEERNSQLLVEAIEKDGDRFKGAPHGDAERSQTEQEPTKRLSLYELSNILHMNWASRARAWASSRLSLNFSARTSLVSHSTVSEQGDDGMLDWERRQVEIYERQRDQFRQEQERFELCQ